MIVGLIAAIFYIIYFNTFEVQWNNNFLPFNIKFTGFFISLFLGFFVFLIVGTIVENIQIL